MQNQARDITSEELRFVTFVIENVASELNTSGDMVYQALSKDSDLLRRYVIPSYDVLHTQSKEYIVNDVIRAMSREGIGI